MLGVGLWCSGNRKTGHSIWAKARPHNPHTHLWLSLDTSPVDEVSSGLWTEGNVVPYTGSQYHSSYLLQRAGHLIQGDRRVVIWSIHHPCWTSRARESESYILDDRGSGPVRARHYTPREDMIIQLGKHDELRLCR